MSDDLRENIKATQSIDTPVLKINGNDKTTALDSVAGVNTGDETQARIATLLHASPNKSSLVDADEVNGTDSANSFSLIRTTWAQVKAFLKTYFDTLYPSGSGTSTGTNTGDNATNSQYSGLASTKADKSTTINGQDLSANRTFTQDDIGDGTTNKQFSASEKTKLAGIATGATANDTDANLKNRANHTGTQTASTISDFNSAALSAAPAETTTTVGGLISGATGKATPVDADTLGLSDSAASGILKSLTWANLKATLKTYFDTLYPSQSNNSWTPSFSDGVGHTLNSARYVKTGNHVHYEIDVTYDNNTSPATAKITGFTYPNINRVAAAVCTLDVSAQYNAYIKESTNELIIIDNSCVEVLNSTLSNARLIISLDYYCS